MGSSKIKILKGELNMKFNVGKTTNYVESVGVGFVTPILIVVLVPIVVIFFALLAIVSPIIGLLGLWKRTE